MLVKPRLSGGAVELGDDLLSNMPIRLWLVGQALTGAAAGFGTDVSSQVQRHITARVERAFVIADTVLNEIAGDVDGTP